MPPDLEVAKGIKNRILAATDDSVQRILLHGSRVSGHAHPNSDYDVLVVMRDPVHDCVGEALRLSELFVDFPQPVDIQVWGEEEFEECRAVPATVAYPAAGTASFSMRTPEGVRTHVVRSWIESARDDLHGRRWARARKTCAASRRSASMRSRPSKSC